MSGLASADDDAALGLAMRKAKRAARWAVADPISEIVGWWAKPVAQPPVPPPLMALPLFEIIHWCGRAETADRSFWAVFRWQDVHGKPPVFEPLAPVLDQLRVRLMFPIKGTRAQHCLALNKALRGRRLAPVSHIVERMPYAIDQASLRDVAVRDFGITRLGRVNYDGSVIEFSKPNAP